MAPSVTAAGYRLISYSQLGQFDSDGPDCEGAEAEYTIAKFGADVLEVLDVAALSYQIVLTKADQVPARELAACVSATAAALAKHPAAYPELITSSSRGGAGIPELRAAIARLLAERAD